MKNIQISTGVYASIWANHEDGDETEDAILRRILGLEAKTSKNNSSEVRGFRDDRFGIVLSEGFEIFRIYKGKEYKAQASKGMWLLMHTGEYYPSLNQLSTALVPHNENAWQNWYYMGENGERCLVSSLRT